MKQASPLLRLLAVLFAATLIAAACGDDDSDDGDGDETSQDEGTTTGDDTDESAIAEIGTAEGESEPSADAASEDLPDEFFSEECQDVYNAFLGAQTQLSSAVTGQVADADQAQDAIEALAESAPDEIAGAFETWADEMGAYFDALAAIDLDGTSQPTAEQMTQLMELSETVDEAALEEAGEEISAYFEEACGE